MQKTEGKKSLVHEIPCCLNKLIRTAVRATCTPEDVLIIDLLVRNRCVEEFDIAELLQFDRRTLRARLNFLLGEKYVHVRTQLTMGSHGKLIKINYYYINFKSFVNALKYRLETVRRRIEVEEHEKHRTFFRCQACNMAFTEMEADLVFNVPTAQFECTQCGGLVGEECKPMLARFNEQMKDMYDLLRESDQYILAEHLIQPAPVDIDTIRSSNKYSAALTNPGGANNEPPKPSVVSDETSVEVKKESSVVGCVSEPNISTTFAEENANEKRQCKPWPARMTESTLYADLAAQSTSAQAIERGWIKLDPPKSELIHVLQKGENGPFQESKSDDEDDYDENNLMYRNLGYEDASQQIDVTSAEGTHHNYAHPIDNLETNSKHSLEDNRADQDMEEQAVLYSNDITFCLPEGGWQMLDQSKNEINGSPLRFSSDDDEGVVIDKSLNKDDPSKQEMDAAVTAILTEQGDGDIILLPLTSTMSQISISSSDESSDSNSDSESSSTSQYGSGSDSSTVSCPNLKNLFRLQEQPDFRESKDSGSESNYISNSTASTSTGSDSDDNILKANKLKNNTNNDTLDN